MLTLREATALVDGRLVSGAPEVRFSGVSTDSRKIRPGDLFVAISGDRFDGHDFIPVAKANGAAAILLGRRVECDLPMIEVSDTRYALGDLARGWRARFTIPVIVVVGSNGKTTTKEMIASILAAEYGEEARLATQGNLNNDIGLPLTLLRLRSAHRAAVIELGMNHPGETRRLAALAAPTVVLITNAQREHQEFMQSVAAVAAEHALAIEALQQVGVAVFPGEDPEAPAWYAATEGRKFLDFAVNATGESSLEVTAVAHLGLFDTVVHLATPAGPVTARLATAGMHNAYNATGAAAAALAAGISLDAVQKGLEQFAPVGGRLQPRRLAGGGLLIDDSYNANPDSMRAAIAVLAQSPGPKLLILGDMGEVGSSGEAFHAEIGRFAKECGLKELYAVGEQMRAATRAFGADARHFSSKEALVEAALSWLGQTGQPDVAVLVKGSRFMAMEGVVAALAEPDDLSQRSGMH